MSHTADPPTRSTAATGWAGWVFFAAFMMILLGIMHAITGLVALFNDEYYAVASSGLIVTVDYTAWGWAHLIGGAILGIAGVALLSGAVWARVIAVLVAMLSTLVNFAFMPAYPLWSLVMVTIDFLVIWAVIVHGHEVRDS